MGMKRGKLISGLSLALVVVMVGPALCCGAARTGGPAEGATVYNLYFGDLHSHTSYSDGTATPDVAYATAREREADFLAITDHFYQLTETEWAAMLLSADQNTEDGAFVAMAGYEYYLQGINEMNIYGTETLAPYPGDTPEASYQGARMTGGSFIPWIYDWISHERGAIGQWNHPLSYGCPTCWDWYQYDFWTEDRDSGVGMIECYNWGYRDESYIKALDAGWHVMPTATEDDHYGDWISPLGIRTVLLAPSLARDELYDAMRAGRGYATLDDNLMITYTLDGAVMGSNLSDAGKDSYTAYVNIVDTDGEGDEITLVEIVTDDGFVIKEYPMSSNCAEITVELSGENAPRYFFVRVTTASPLNGEIGEGLTAWTAPVWTGN